MVNDQLVIRFKLFGTYILPKDVYIYSSGNKVKKLLNYGKNRERLDFFMNLR